MSFNLTADKAAAAFRTAAGSNGQLTQKEAARAALQFKAQGKSSEARLMATLATNDGFFNALDQRNGTDGIAYTQGQALDGKLSLQEFMDLGQKGADGKHNKFNDSDFTAVANTTCVTSGDFDDIKDDLIDIGEVDGSDYSRSDSSDSEDDYSSDSSSNSNSSSSSSSRSSSGGGIQQLIALITRLLGGGGGGGQSYGGGFGGMFGQQQQPYNPFGGGQYGGFSQYGQQQQNPFGGFGF